MFILTCSNVDGHNVWETYEKRPNERELQYILEDYDFGMPTKDIVLDLLNDSFCDCDDPSITHFELVEK